MKNLYTYCLVLFLVLIYACNKKYEADRIPSPKISSPDYHKDGDVVALRTPVADGVNIVILGDAFIKEDLKKGGVFDTKVKEVIDYLFTVPPFDHYKESFNTYVVYAESRRSGAAVGFTPGTSYWSKFNSYFDPVVSRRLAVGDLATLQLYIDKALPPNRVNLVILLVNDPSYGGSGGRVAVSSTSISTKYVMVHEIGHTFAGLGDEYIDVAVANQYAVDVVQRLPNVDTTNDPTKIKWAHYYNRAFYKNKIGAFEGAYYRQKGFYRPEDNSVMRGHTTTNFNAPSREAIARMIHSIRKIPFDLEAFLKMDSLSVPAPPYNLFPYNLNTKIDMPHNDFIDMEKRLLELESIRKKSPGDR